MEGRDSTQRKNQLGKSTAQKSQQEKEVEIGNGVKTKVRQSKAMVAPGSLGAYRQMKTQLKEKEKRSKQSDLLLQQRQLQPVNMTRSQPVNMASSQGLLGSSQAQSFSQPQRLGSHLQGFSQPQTLGSHLQEDNENHISSNYYNLELYADEEDDLSDGLSTLTPEMLGMQVEPPLNQEHQSEQIGNNDQCNFITYLF